MKNIHPFLSLFLLLAIIYAGTFSAFLERSLGADATSRIVVGNSPPVVSSVILNNGNPITLTAGTGTLVRVNFTISDNNGCGDVMFGTSTPVDRLNGSVFRSGVGQACAANTLNCYTESVSFEHSCPYATTTQTSFNATATMLIYYFAQATDASSSFPSENWMGYLEAGDASNATGSATSTGVELNSMNAIDLASSSLAYGTVSPGTDTTSTNQTATVVNAGNTSTTLQISGTALSSGGNILATSSQHYATSTFTYGGLEQALSATAQAVSGFLIPQPPLTSWTLTTALPNVLDGHSVAMHNNFLYAIGGSESGTESTSTVHFAPLNSTGSVGSWTSTSPLVSPVTLNPAATYGGYLYVSGGQNGTFGPESMTSTVQFAPINSTGSVGSWTVTTRLPTSTAHHAMVPYNGRLYVIGGTNGSVTTSSVYFAPINTTGSVGTWTSTTPLPQGVRLHASTIHDGHLYVLGGIDPASARTSTVLFAPINSTGSIGAWSSLPSLPLANMGFDALANEGIIYVAGGSSATGVTSTVLFSPIAADNTINSWSQGVALPSPLYGYGAGSNNGYLYITGGNPNVNRTSTVLFTSLASRNTYWGLSVPGGSPAGTYTGTVNYTAVFSP